MSVTVQLSRRMCAPVSAHLFSSWITQERLKVRFSKKMSTICVCLSKDSSSSRCQLLVLPSASEGSSQLAGFSFMRKPTFIAPLFPPLQSSFAALVYESPFLLSRNRIRSLIHSAYTSSPTHLTAAAAQSSITAWFSGYSPTTTTHLITFKGFSPDFQIHLRRDLWVEVLGQKAYIYCHYVWVVGWH